MKPKITKSFISKENLESIKELSERVKFIEADGVRRRMGVNGNKKPSVYSVSKWDNMIPNHRDFIKKLIKDSVIEKTIICWFLKFPAVSGFLDTIATWKDKKMADAIQFTSLSINDKQRIIIDGELYTLNAGEAITFSIRSVHQVPHSDNESLWLCFMTAN